MKLCAHFKRIQRLDPKLGRFITEDPIRDSSNWYAYVANNPLRFIDPTGLRFSEDLDEDYDRYKDREIREAKELKVREKFKYMSGYELTSSEIDDYFDLANLDDKKLSIIDNPQDYKTDEEWIAAIEDAQKQYYEKLAETLHLQNELTPDGSDACAYRALQAGVELALGRPMPLSMIDEATKNFPESVLDMTIPGGKLPGSEYYVKKPIPIINDALQRLGRPDLRGVYGSPSEALQSFTKNKGNSITSNIEHFNTGSSNASFTWDSYSGVVNHNKNVLRIDTFSIIRR